MSGRSRPYLRDGIPIGYRKTDRRQRRTEAWERPTLTVVFPLPGILMLAVAPGVHAEGIEVTLHGSVHVSLTTMDRKAVFHRVAQFLQTHLPSRHAPFVLDARFLSTSEPGWSERWRIGVIDRHVFAASSGLAVVLSPAPE